jgi:hypothetical protein
VVILGVGGGLVLLGVLVIVLVGVTVLVAVILGVGGGLVLLGVGVIVFVGVTVEV